MANTKWENGCFQEQSHLSASKTADEKNIGYPIPTAPL